MKLCLLILLFTASVGAQRHEGMVRIPGGTFEMGTDRDDIPKLQERFGVTRAALFFEEVPRHQVKLKSFYLDRTEVTNQAFKRFVDKHAKWRKDSPDAGRHNGKYLQHWTNGTFPSGQENYPVTFVTWFAAEAFCRSVGKRLPKEAEWEFAARGGLIGKEFPWGDEMPDATRANFSASGIGRPTKVASYPPNSYGLYDMAGNVWELLFDPYTRYDPWGGKPHSGPPADFFPGSRVALRGGSFGGSPVNLRVRYRDSHQLGNAVEHVGFRCAAN